MMTECDRLRDLKVRESRHDGGSVRFGQIEQRASQDAVSFNEALETVYREHVGG